MAEKALTNQFEHFDLVASQIHQTFDPLIAELYARRDALLMVLSHLKEDHETKEKTRKAGIKEIEDQLQLLTLRENINIPVYQKARDAFREGLQKLEIPTRLPHPLFQCPQLNKLKSLIANLGEVVEWVLPEYSLKKEPILTVGKYGSGVNEFKAAGLAIDHKNEMVYIADCMNSRVQIVSLEGQFIHRFREDTLQLPCGIAVTKEYIFITDIGMHALLQFDKNGYNLFRRTGSKGSKDGQFNSPRGLCIDYNGEIFVANSNNNRLTVFSIDLQFISNIGVGQLQHPTDVKLTHNNVVVIDLSPNCVHFYSKNGHLLRSCITQGEGQGCSLNTPLFFCLDAAGNLIISDWKNDAIKIFSKSGQVIHTIGRTGQGRGELKAPEGISITHAGTVFVVSSNPNYSIQSF